jgi:hypothetical protein
MVSVIYKKRALPIAWIVVRGKKGHFPETAHIALIQEVERLVPDVRRWSLQAMGNSTGFICRQPYTNGAGVMYAARARISSSSWTVRNTAVKTSLRWSSLMDTLWPRKSCLLMTNMAQFPALAGLVGKGLQRSSILGDKHRLCRAGLPVLSQTVLHRDVLLGPKEPRI